MKGGKLARLISPAQTLSLILSDIIGDPLDFIASGPTVLQAEDPQERLRILEKYGLQLSEEVLEVVAREDREDVEDGHSPPPDVLNLLIGTNEAPLRAAEREASRMVDKVVLLTRKLSGQARTVGRDLARLVVSICLGRGDSVRDILASLGVQGDCADIIGNWQHTHIDNNPLSSLHFIHFHLYSCVLSVPV